MKHYYPSYYQRFRCIAAACPDSCCQGWDVVIDSDTEAFYHTVQGELGKRLRETIYTDPDGDRIFTLAEEKKCPFWGADRLCDIYRELGEEHLCATCALFPRITMDYTVFTEHTLALACPEAARLILAEKAAYADFTHTDTPACEDYPPELMRFLLRTRRQAAQLLSADKPLSDRLEDLLAFAKTAQQELTGEAVELSAVELPELYAGLEYIDEDNRGRLVAASERAPEFRAYDKELTNLALYWLYRYWLGAIDSLDLIAPTRFLIASVKTVANLSKDEDIVAAAQRYSKEIEQSYENMEILGSLW